MTINIVKHGADTVAGEVRRKMIEGAMQLLARRGLQATSFAEVLEHTGAPRGSVYHHFPEGQGPDGGRGGGPRGRVPGRPDGSARRRVGIGDHRAVPGDLARRVDAVEVRVRLRGARRRRRHGFAGPAEPRGRGCSGCGAASSRGLLEQGGLAKKEARRFATVLVASAEGAVVMSRAEQDIEPFETVARQLLDQVRALAA